MAAITAEIPIPGAAGYALGRVPYHKHFACALEEGRGCLASRAASTESEQSLTFTPQLEVVVQKDAEPAATVKEAPGAGADQRRSLVLWVPKPKSAQVVCQCNSLLSACQAAGLCSQVMHVSLQ